MFAYNSPEKISYGVSAFVNLRYSPFLRARTCTPAFASRHSDIHTNAV